MAFNDFLKSFQAHKKKKQQQQQPLLPVTFMVKLYSSDDTGTVNILNQLADRTDFPDYDDEIHVVDSGDEYHQTVYLSIYGFELLAQELKRRILDQSPLDDDSGRKFSEITVDLSIIQNKFHTEDGSYDFLGSETRADFERVSLRSDFINATYLIYQLLFFSYDQDALSDMDVESEYQNLRLLAQDIKDNYKQQNDVDDRNLASIPEYHDFERQNPKGVVIPALTDNDTGDDHDKHPTDDTADTSDDDTNSSDSDDDTSDPAQSLIDDDSKENDQESNDESAPDGSTSKDTSSTDEPEHNDDKADNDEPDDEAEDDAPSTQDDSERSNPTDSGEAKTIGEIRKEQESREKRDDERTDDSNDDDSSGSGTSPDTPENIINNIYAPHLYQMNIEFPQFTIDQKMDEPPKLDEAIKHNNFEDQLYIVQETNRMRKQANAYLQQEAQQVNRNFNFDMGRTVMQVYKRLNDRIHDIQRKGQDNQKLDQSVQQYYDQQSQEAFDRLKQNKDDSLDQRLDSLRQEYEQKKQDLITQSNQEYEDNRNHINSRIQADAERMRNDNLNRRNQYLNQQIEQSKQQAEQYLSHHLQNKADKYKDMADNLGQRLFTALQNNLNAEYPKLIDHVSILMNQQSQFNYSNKRLNESRSSVYQKRLDDSQAKLRQARQEQADSTDDYENRINGLQRRLDQRNDTSKKYDQALAEKSDLQDRIGRVQHQMDSLQQKNDDLKKQLKDAPLGKPDTTAKARSTELNYQSLQSDYHHLEEISNEYKNQVDSLKSELDSRKHFWEKK